MTRICKICGCEFETIYTRQLICSDRECQAESHRRRVRAYDKAHPNRGKKKKKKGNDHIIGNGYAERQMANTLAMVGRINIDL